uniref:Metallophos domain-containing protein n=1 Tax=Rhabditophanes sp. KR3021 TaxID=114890 RepID=A0AC35UAT3_9BILA
MISEKILCMHGGISKHLASISQLRNIPRPNNIEGNSLKTDLLWSDPDIQVNLYEKSPRGCSYVFGERVLRIIFN